jgi:hypothetical protein
MGSPVGGAASPRKGHSSKPVCSCRPHGDVEWLANATYNARLPDFESERMDAARNLISPGPLCAGSIYPCSPKSADADENG